MNYLLKNGLVYNGSTEEPIKQDVYIENGIIKAIGVDLNKDCHIIDCTDLVVAPGFIDGHSHNDFFVKSDIIEESILPFLKQGITTQIVGNCGFSAYGVHADSKFKDLIGGGLFRTTNPSSLNDYAKDVSGKLILNIVPLIGHCTTRTAVAGKGARNLTKEERQKQLDLLEQGLKEGAFGGSFGLMYEPGMFAPREELIEYAKMIQKYDGILTIHTRANSKIALGYSLIGKPHIEQALDEVIEMMEETHVRTEYSHLIYVGKKSWPYVDRMLKKFKDARKKGFEIAYDMYPFTYGASVITVILPSWYLKLSEEERKKPFNRFKLKVIITLTKKLLGIDYSDLVISYIGKEYPQYEGKTVAEIAEEENRSPFDTYLRLVDLSEGHGGIMLGKYYNEDIILKMMQDDLSIYMTDAWYEKKGAQNAGTYQAFPFFLQKTKENHIPLQETIHKMTGKTAERFKIPNRGYIKEGYAADITVFNYDRIMVNEKVPHETPQGINYVFVNGVLTIDHNKYTDARSGAIIRKQ